MPEPGPKLRGPLDGGGNPLNNTTDEVVTVDPTGIVGRRTFRSDLFRPSYYDGAAWQRIAKLADSLSAFAVPTADIPLGGFGFTGGRDPVNPQDLVTKAYADALAAGLDIRNEAAYATNAAVPAYTYANGAAGVGATVTFTATGAQTVDGQATALGDRLLFRDANAQAASDAGLYVVSTLGAGGVHEVWTRSTDFDQAAEIHNGIYVLVLSGTAWKAAGFVMTQRGAITVGTTAILWTRFSVPATGTQKFAADVGDGATNPIVLPHGLGTADLTIHVREQSTGDRIECGISNDATNVTLSFSVIATAAQYRVVAVG